MKKRFFFFLSLIPALALAAQGADNPKHYTLGALKGPSGIALIRLFEEPPALPSGASLQLIAVPSADVMAAKVISGEYDAAVLPINMAAKLRSAGVPIELAAVIGNGMLSLLTTDPGFSSLADLKGEELNVAGQGATPDYLIQRLLKDAGLDPKKDLRLAYALPYPEMATALAAGKIRYALLPEPFVTLARMANPGIRAPLDLKALWKRSTGHDDYPMTALVFRSDFPAEGVKVVLEAARESIAWVVAEPKEASLLVEKHNLGLKAPIAAQAIPKTNYVFLPAGEAKSSVEALLSVFLETAPASIGGKLPEESFYASF